jgi:hypothetical protein
MLTIPGYRRPVCGRSGIKKHPEFKYLTSKSMDFKVYVTVKGFKTSGPVTKQNMFQNTAIIVVIFLVFSIILLNLYIMKDFSV